MFIGEGTHACGLSGPLRYLKPRTYITVCFYSFFQLGRSKQAFVTEAEVAVSNRPGVTSAQKVPGVICFLVFLLGC